MFGRKENNFVVIRAKNGLGAEGLLSLIHILSGTTEFKRNEMIQIKKEFPDCSLDYLFATENKNGA